MPSEYDEQRRRELIRQLEEKDRNLQAEARDFEALIAKRRQDVEAQLSRLKADPPPGDMCLDCWVTHGRVYVMANHPERPVQPMRDRYVCPNCLVEELRPA